ncbi:MAG: hypothetical protein AB7U63_17035 [Porticoccaceae bacterium]
MTQRVQDVGLPGFVFFARVCLHGYFHGIINCYRHSIPLVVCFNHNNSSGFVQLYFARWRMPCLFYAAQTFDDCSSQRLIYSGSQSHERQGILAIRDFD